MKKYSYMLLIAILFMNPLSSMASESEGNQSAINDTTKELETKSKKNETVESSDKEQSSSAAKVDTKKIRLINQLPDLDENLIDLTNVFGSFNGNTQGSENVGLKFDNKLLRFTDRLSQNMSIWAKNKINLDRDFKFTSYLYLGNSGSAAGDGITLTFQNRSNTLIGKDGGALGIYTSLGESEGLHIEFDTYLNQDSYDHGENLTGISSPGHHVSFVKPYGDGPGRYPTHSNPQVINNSSINSDGLSDGTWKRLDVTWDAKNRCMSYKVTQATGPNKGALIAEDSYIDTSSLSGDVYWGYTGSTGYYFQENAMVFANIPQKIEQEIMLSPKDITAGDTTELKITHAINYSDWLNRKITIDIGNSEFTEYVSGSLTVDGKPVTPIVNSQSGELIIENGLSDLVGNGSKSVINLKIKGKKAITNNTITVKSTGIDQYNTKQSATNTVDLEVIKPSVPTLELKDTTLYVGQKFDPNSPFKNVTDIDGNKLTAENIVYYMIDKTLTKELDTSITGEHKVQIGYPDSSGKIIMSNEATISVKKDQTSLSVKNLSYAAGDEYHPKDAFVKATDVAGNNVSRSDTIFKVTGDAVNTAIAGVYKQRLTYNYQLNGVPQSKSADYTVTVKESTYDIEETLYDVKGNELSEKQITTIEQGKEFIPKPDKYYTKQQDLYIYKGWLEDTQIPGNDIPKEGNPPKTTINKKYYYIYEQADQFINVTIPTEIVFGTLEDTKTITSKKYNMKNNSNSIGVGVTVDNFSTIKSDVTLLGENDQEPSIEERSAKLNLLIDNKPAIIGLNENVTKRHIVDLTPNQSSALGINGEYFGTPNEKNIVDYQMNLKFKAIPGNEN